MIKSGKSYLLFIILISPYPTGQPTSLKECFKKKISTKMTSVQGHDHPRQERLSVALFSVAPLDFSLSPKSEFFK